MVAGVWLVVVGMLGGVVRLVERLAAVCDCTLALLHLLLLGLQQVQVDPTCASQTLQATDTNSFMCSIHNMQSMIRSQLRYVERLPPG